MVLVVDPDRAAAGRLLALLHGAGLATRAIPSADELSSAVSEGPACVLADLDLPGGAALLEEVGRSGAHLPVIFRTRSSDVRAAVRAMKAGAADILLEPLDGEQLAAAARLALERAAHAWTHRAEIERTRTSFASLTPSEKAVAALVARGLLSKQIAARLGVVEQTIR